jgi:hypothetical protein
MPINVARADVALIGLGESLYLMGGTMQYGDADVKDDVWISNDGMNWTKVLEHAGFGKSILRGVLEFGGKIWAIADGSNFYSDSGIWVGTP